MHLITELLIKSVVFVYQTVFIANYILTGTNILCARMS